MSSLNVLFVLIDQCELDKCQCSHMNKQIYVFDLKEHHPPSINDSMCNKDF